MDKQRQKYKGLLDMIDGGGAGAVGNEFEGGGILSVIANALATPYGSEDRMRDAMQEQRPIARPIERPMQGISLNSGPEMQRLSSDESLSFPASINGAFSDGLGPMPQRLQGDPSLGFNPANAAPVQPSAPGYTQHSSFKTPTNNYVPSSTPFDPSAAVDFTMPDGSPINPPAPQPSQEQIAQKFGEDMVNAYGREEANAIMSSPNGQGVYLHYINNGYQLPAL